MTSFSKDLESLGNDARVSIAGFSLRAPFQLGARGHDDHFGEADGDAENEDGDQPDNNDDHDHAEDLPTLLRWLRTDFFGHCAVNQQLAQLEMTDVQAAA